MPHVFVVVLNWNGLADTIACLETLQRSDYVKRSVVVVDNGSREDEAGTIRAQFPDATVLETGCNLGYAGGNNVGLKYAAQAGAEYLFVLNNDTEVEPGCLSALVEAGMGWPEAGAVGCFVYAQAPPHDFLYAGLHTQTVPEEAVMGSGRYDSEVVSLLETRSPVRVDSAHGCGFALTRRAYEKVGGFDSKFFAVHEEVDWCVRAREAGFEIIAAPTARIRHKVSASFGNSSPDRLYYEFRNLALYYHNRVPSGARLPLRWWLSYAACIKRHVRGESEKRQTAHVQAILEAGWDGLRLRGGQRRPRHVAATLASGIVSLERLLSRGRHLYTRAYWGVHARLSRVARQEAMSE